MNSPLKCTVMQFADTSLTELQGVDGGLLAQGIFYVGQKASEKLTKVVEDAMWEFAYGVREILI